MELTTEQNNAIENIARDLNAGKPFTTMGGFAGTGKQQPVDCHIQTPNGYTRLGDLNIGEEIFSINGKIIKVKGIFPQGVKQSYKITFRDGSHTEAGEDHLWKVIQGNKTNKILTTQQILKIGLRFDSGPYRFKIPLCKPVQYEEKELPIHPYLLGIFIGDGTSLGKSPTLSTPDIDVEIINITEKLVPEYISIKEDRSSSCPRYRFRDLNNYRNRLSNIFKNLKLNVKSTRRFIPKIYKHSSIDQRHDLLNGLMDTDGSCRNNRTSFSTSSKHLRDDVIELVQSLGGIAIKQKDDERHENINYTLNIKMFNNPFKIKRKAKKWSFSKKNPPSRYITSINKSRIVEQKCISVDSNDGLYLTDNYIVTHNTTVLTELRRHIGKNTRVAFASFTGKAASVLRDKVIQADAYNKRTDYIGTIHGLMYTPIVFKKFSEAKGEYIETISFKRQNTIESDIILVDEASMVGSKIFKDMFDFDVQIVACGDSFQLPPVGDMEEGSVVASPDYLLTEVHRTAQDSSLVKLAHAIRTKQYLPIEPYQDESIKIMSYHSGGKEFLEGIEYDSETVTLCFTNAVRQSINQGFRHKKGYNPKIILYPFEQIVCLTNNPNLGMMNGERFGIEFLTPPFDGEYLNVTVERQDGNYQEVFVYNTLPKFGRKNVKIKSDKKKRFKKGDETDPMVIDADYGYAMTVHKSQGSEFKNVCLVDSALFKGISSSKQNDDYLRWLYTGVTRSSENLTIITDYPNA